MSSPPCATSLLNRLGLGLCRERRAFVHWSVVIAHRRYVEERVSSSTAIQSGIWWNEALIDTHYYRRCLFFFSFVLYSFCIFFSWLSLGWLVGTCHCKSTLQIQIFNRRVCIALFDKLSFMHYKCFSVSVWYQEYDFSIPITPCQTTFIVNCKCFQILNNVTYQRP